MKKEIAIFIVVVMAAQSAFALTREPNSVGNVLGDVRTGVIRLILRETDPIPGEPRDDHFFNSKLKFNPPDQFQYLKDPRYNVFSEEGGQGVYKKADGSFMADGKDSNWFFNPEFNIAYSHALPGDTEDLAYMHNDIVAFLPGIKKEECKKEAKHHITRSEFFARLTNAIPKLKSDQSALYKKNMVTTKDGDYEGPGPARMGLRLDHPDLHGIETQGCFQSFDGKEYVFFYMILAR